MQVCLCGRAGVLSEFGQTLADCRGGFSDPRPGLDPGTRGLTVVIYGVNRCTHGSPSLVQLRGDSPVIARFPHVRSIVGSPIRAPLADQS